ncbi:MFS transporter [Pseudonocardia kunmingensis]|uniref:Na+/melibiose symporter-like transporter n=1 Tax=Pseudonocardia kunmingensis TaxID=630975 RepID=A0A543DQC8_9PSEU|nr:MFS transporter [Pseudonocardia kunmingensis]TQM11541.1 Na+/melibiose symporter-like transporter [Pseudonocardia kunmingensis]
MGETHDAAGGKQVRAAGIASIAGWAMDLYDLTIILYLASTIGPLLFPSDNATLQLTFVYASFAVTLLFRPLGSAIFGAYADRNGRKRAMLVAILGVGLSTALMGAVPTYAAAGLLAPLVFLVLRVIQGIFVGGVVVSTHTLGTETVPARHRGLMSGVVAGGGAGAGAVVASMMYFLVAWLFPGEAFASYGWRVLFFTGLLTAAFSFYIYRRTDESPLWKGTSSAPAARKSPLRELVGPRYRTAFLLNIAIAAGGATTYYLTLGVFPTFFERNIGFDKTAAAVLLIVANAGVIAGGVLGGHLSDRFGRRAVFLGFGLPNLVTLPVLYLWMASLGPADALTVAVLSTVMAIMMMSASAPILIFLNERFPTEIRATGTGLSWNLGFAIGGITPSVITALSPEVADLPGRLAIGITIAAIVMVLGVLVVGETRHLGLGEHAGPTARPAHVPHSTSASPLPSTEAAQPANE